MASNHHTDQVFKEKKIVKGDIKFNVSLNEEQKLAKARILENDITVLKGIAGCGKTFLATAVGLSMLLKKEIEKLVITRPTVSREDIGFLPGTLQEKMDPWLAPIYHNLHMLKSKAEIDKLIEDEKIIVLPFAFMQGVTFVNSFVISDESENLLPEQIDMLVGRLGKGSKMVVCGDTAQIMLKSKKDSGFHLFNKVEGEGIKGFQIITLIKNHRHEIVEPILAIFAKYRD